ncbi:phytanoyl-CoA dioxygenase family protein [Anatilimnocola sp. NA78]|uniref:phytanoyl-CoA dioxygenase family protein n=1 Tax=Anatilimnocola sp. NA78 TaxID=3415683 RepID=UPI003CE490A0
MSLAPTPALAAEQIAGYHETGFLVVRNVFSPEEMALLAAEADTLFSRTELIDTQNIRCRWQNHAETAECRFDCFDPVIDIGPVCRYFAYDRRILDLVSSLYDDEAHLFKDKLIFKPPQATGYALHQDFIGWKEFPESFLTVIVALDATDATNGATEVFPGYHKQGYLAPRDGDYHQMAPDAVDESTGVLLLLNPGDLAMFSGFTPHRSGPNQSDSWRRQLYLSYNAGRDGGNQRDAHYQQFHEWLVTKYAECGKTGVYFQ